MRRIVLSAAAGILAAALFSGGLFLAGASASLAIIGIYSAACGALIFLGAWTAISAESASRRAGSTEKLVRQRIAKTSEELMAEITRVEKRLARNEKVMRTIVRANIDQNRQIKRGASASGKLHGMLHAMARPYGDISPHDVFPELSSLASSGRPVLVGPWTTEVGYELLYWIPFLRQILRAHGVPPSQVVAVSRGGVKPWYEGVADGYVELIDVLGEEGFRRYTAAYEAENEGKKAVEPYAPETALLERVAAEAGVEEPIIFSPYRMNRLFRPAWSGRAGAEPVLPYLAFEPIRAGMSLPDGFPLQGGYAAVKYYYSSCFPDTEANRQFVRRSVASLAERQPVVLLGMPVSLDDHEDAVLPEMANVYSARDFLLPRDNLAIQTAIVANADSLYCTYGGFSYLGLLTGVDTEAVFSVPDYIGTHLDLAMKLPKESMFGCMTVRRIGSGPARGKGDQPPGRPEVEPARLPS